MAQTNGTIITAAFINASNDFQQRVPAPDKAGFEATARFLLEPYNNKYFNEFTGLLYQIGLTIVESKAFENPLRRFKKEPLYYGNTVREIAAPWIEAHSFDPCDETLLKCENPDFTDWFYTINREDRYDWSISTVELRKALAGGENGYQLNALMLSKTQAAINSDNYDEMMIMLNLVAFADKNWGNGLFKKQVAEPTDQASAQNFLATVKSDIANLKFPSRLYNSIDIPVFARQDELVLLITPEAAAKTDVYSWFNRLVGLKLDDQAGVVVEVPEIPINGAFAMLTTSDWFQCRDSFYGIWNFVDPKGMKEQYFLHHQGSYAASPYVPCIVYTTGAGSATDTITVAVTGLNFAPKVVKDDGTEVILQINGAGAVKNVSVSTEYLEKGNAITMGAYYIGSVTPNDTPVKVPTAGVTYTLQGISLNDKSTSSIKNAITPTKRTYISDDGILHVQKLPDIASTEAINIVFAYSGSYINPSGTTANLAGTISVVIAEA